jgi:hypothetical protein
MQSTSLQFLSTNLLLAWVLLGFPLLAQEAEEPQAVPAGAGTDSVVKAGLKDIKWIAGKWQGRALGGEFEETWNPPRGDSMMGMFKLVVDGKMRFCELLLIQPQGESLVLRLKHFSPGLVGWEEKEQSIEFPLLAIQENRVQFDGLTFERISQDEMHILVSVKQGEQPNELKFECHRFDEKATPKL